MPSTRARAETYHTVSATIVRGATSGEGARAHPVARMTAASGASHPCRRSVRAAITGDAASWRDAP